MAADTKIEWCDHTFNPWEGCQKVGPGCHNCYAETRNARFAGGTAINWGPGAPRRRTSASNWAKPVKWNAQAKAFAAEHGRRQRVFCASLADVFDNAVDPQWRADLFNLIQRTPNLDWLLLTKRIGNVRGMLAEISHAADNDLTLLDLMPLPNVWIGATIVNQAEADRDIPKLLAVPARVRFLSMEPLLGPVDLTELQPPGIERTWLDALRGRAAPLGGSQPSIPTARIDWVIAGGESGSGARPMHPAWARSLRDQCQAAGTPFLFKQWGEWIAEGIAMQQPLTKPPQLHQRRWVADDAEDDRYTRTAAAVYPVGKKAAGRLLDGRTWDGVPAP